MATVRYREIRGTREAKYAAAESLELGSDGWTEVSPTAPYWSFAPSEPADDAGAYETWPSVVDIFPVSTSGIQSSHDDLVVDVTRADLEAKIRAVEDRSNSDEALKERYSITENDRWVWSEHRAAFTGYDSTRVIPWLYRLFDRRYIYWDAVFVQWPRTKVMRHLLPRPYGFGGEDRLALVVQRARPIATIATVTRGPVTAHVSGNWCHVYPLRLSDATIEETLLPASDEWRENVAPSLVEKLAGAYKARPSVEDIAWYVFGVLSAPSYRRRFARALEIDHPRIPFPSSHESFEATRDLGLELGRAHLLEGPVAADIRFVGTGTGLVSRIEHDAATDRVRINATQAFTGVPEDVWTWGEGFRPLEHFLQDRHGRRLDAKQIAAFQATIHAVREAIRLEPQLDSALQALLDAGVLPVTMGA